MCNVWFQIQGIHKRMVRLQKLTRNLFHTLQGYNVHRQQRQLSKFLMRYQQFASYAYCGAAGPVSKLASQQEKAFCVLRFEVSRSVITVQREFRARFRKDASCVFSKPCTFFCVHPVWSVAYSENTPVYSLLMTVIVISEAVKAFCVYFTDMEYMDTQESYTPSKPVQERLQVLEPIP